VRVRFKRQTVYLLCHSFAGVDQRDIDLFSIGEPKLLGRWIVDIPLLLMRVVLIDLISQLSWQPEEKRLMLIVHAGSIIMTKRVCDVGSLHCEHGGKRAVSQRPPNHVEALSFGQGEGFCVRKRASW